MSVVMCSLHNFSAVFKLITVIIPQIAKGVCVFIGMRMSSVSNYRYILVLEYIFTFSLFSFCYLCCLLRRTLCHFHFNLELSLCDIDVDNGILFH